MVTCRHASMQTCMPAAGNHACIHAITQAVMQNGRHACIHTWMYACRQTFVQTDRQTGTDTHTDTHTNPHRDINMHTYTCICSIRTVWRACRYNHISRQPDILTHVDTVVYADLLSHTHADHGRVRIACIDISTVRHRPTYGRPGGCAGDQTYTPTGWQTYQQTRRPAGWHARRQADRPAGRSANRRIARPAGRQRPTETGRTSNRAIDIPIDDG